MATQSKKPKIVCLHLYNDFSGAPLVLSEVISGLKSRGYEIDLHTSCCKGDGFLSKIDDISYYHTSFRWSSKRYKNLFRFFFNQFILFFKLLMYWRQDVVIYINTLWPFAGGLAGRSMGKKIIYHLHETSIKPKRLKKFLSRILDNSANDAIYVSRYLKNKNPVKKTTSHIVYNALSPDFIENMFPKEEPDEFIVLMLCSLKKYKGVNEFIQLAARLSNYKFELVVSAPEERVNSFFKNTRFPDNMSIYAAQKNVHPFYARASLVLNLSHPNRWLESFGLTVLEAMNYGVPAIIPPHGGISELVHEGYNGYKISVKKLDTISEQIQIIAENKEIYRELSLHALEMSKRFNYDEMINSIDEIIQQP